MEFCIMFAKSGMKESNSKASGKKNIKPVKTSISQLLKFVFILTCVSCKMSILKKCSNKFQSLSDGMFPINRL